MTNPTDPKPTEREALAKAYWEAAPPEEKLGLGDWSWDHVKGKRGSRVFWAKADAALTRTPAPPQGDQARFDRLELPEGEVPADPTWEMTHMKVSSVDDGERRIWMRPSLTPPQDHPGDATDMIGAEELREALDALQLMQAATAGQGMGLKCADDVLLKHGRDIVLHSPADPAPPVKRPTDDKIIRALDDCLTVIGDLLTRHNETLAGQAHVDIFCGAVRVRDRLAGRETAEPYDIGRISTHSAECWSWGPRHYECAVREIERLRAETTR